MRYITAALAIAFTFGCTKPKDLQFIDVQNIRMINLGLAESTIGLDVRFFNPNHHQVKLKDAAAKVYANSAYLGDTHMDSTITVPRNDTFAIPLTLTVPTLTAIGKLMQGLKDTLVDIKIQGSVKMGKAGIFISYPINYERKQSISNLNF